MATRTRHDIAAAESAISHFGGVKSFVGAPWIISSRQLAPFPVPAADLKSSIILFVSFVKAALDH